MHINTFQENLHQSKIFICILPPDKWYSLHPKETKMSTHKNVSERVHRTL